jgi:hypothetical protein
VAAVENILAWCAELRFGLVWITAAPGAVLCICVLTLAAAWLHSLRMDAAARTGTVSFCESSSVATVN